MKTRFDVIFDEHIHYSDMNNVYNIIQFYNDIANKHVR